MIATCHLAVNFSPAKAIPYGAVDREDGDRNHGFLNLKMDPSLIDEVPECVDDQSLYVVIATLNRSGGALLSIGCLSGDVREQRGHRVSGYVEFAWNSVEGIADAGHYFPLFFHFSSFLHTSNFNRRGVFNWEIEQGYFHEVPAKGFTASVFVNTDFYPSQDEAHDAWGEALERLAEFFKSVRSDPNQTRLYTPHGIS